jgi:hypothetical protein
MTPSVYEPPTDWLFPPSDRAPIVIVMDGLLSPAEELPTLYRAVLDRVADLERIGQRREALLVRAEATRVYSKSWDDGARRRLTGLCRRADRVMSGVERPRTPRPTRGRALGSGRRPLATR